MSNQEQHKYMSWCLNNGIKIYPVTEFEYQHRKLLTALNKGEIGKEIYKMKRESLLATLIKSEQLHIAVERKNRVSIGEMVFYSNKKNKDNVLVHEQIYTLYRMIYEKENFAVTT
jgi:hypothetical protein